MDKGLFNKIAKTMRDQFPNASDDVLLEKAYQEYNAQMKKREEARANHRKGVADGSIKPSRGSFLSGFLFNDNSKNDSDW
jgi:hypothetical protein